MLASPRKKWIFPFDSQHFFLNPSYFNHQPLKPSFHASTSNQILLLQNSRGQSLFGEQFMEGDHMVMGLLLSQRPPPTSIYLLQNCDLPPPAKVFCSREGNASELLKALWLSQARTREADRVGAEIAKERDRLYNALVEDSLRVFAYRQWVKLLELQVSQMETKLQQLEWASELVKQEDNCGEDGRVGTAEMAALALCLGIAGVGLAFGYRYFF